LLKNLKDSGSLPDVSEISNGMAVIKKTTFSAWSTESGL